MKLISLLALCLYSAVGWSSDNSVIQLCEAALREDVTLMEPAWTLLVNTVGSEIYTYVGEPRPEAADQHETLIVSDLEAERRGDQLYIRYSLHPRGDKDLTRALTAKAIQEVPEIAEVSLRLAGSDMDRFVEALAKDLRPSQAVKLTSGYTMLAGLGFGRLVSFAFEDYPGEQSGDFAARIVMARR